MRDAPAGTYSSPFKGSSKADKIPDWSHYKPQNGANTNLLFQYFMVGTMGAITAAGAKSTVQGE
jgi:ubiquinol-cytochrome c reductase iron-sulfur subunit